MNIPSIVVINKIIDLYLYKFSMLDTSEQNKYSAPRWIQDHWDDYEDTWPFFKRTNSK